MTLLELIRRHGGRMTALELTKSCRRYRPIEKAEQALEEIFATGEDARWEGKYLVLTSADSTPEQSVTDDLCDVRQKTDDSFLQKKYKQSLAEILDRDQQIAALTAIKNKPIQHCVVKQNTQRCLAESVAVVIPATDWHVGEKVFSEATGGKNYYDINEAAKRINKFYTSAIELLEWQRHRNNVSEIWHPLLGDLMTGAIHDDLLESNELSPVEACVFLRDMLCAGIDFLRSQTGLPVFIPTCVGNHGRTTLKPRVKTSCRNSYEWLLYKTLEKIYEKDADVHFFVGTGYHNTQKIMDRLVRFHHGDSLQYQGGVGGITIPVNKAIAQWDKVSPVDLDVFGHFHQFLEHYPKWVACGTLMGYSEFSVKIKAEFQHPTQTFIVISRQFGIDLAKPIYLTESQRDKTAVE
jgi:hypothetical protein